MNCEFKQKGDKWVCHRCGRKVTVRKPTPPKANCSGPKRWGFGDIVAALLSALGFKKCGGCKRRQEWLNEKFPL